MENPTTEHMVAVKRVLRYIAGTLHFGCYYQRKKEAQLIGYCDADLAGDIDTKKAPQESSTSSAPASSLGNHKSRR